VTALGVQFAPLDVDGRSLSIEYAWIDAARPGAPLLVFLHEGLGSLAMWRDFPRRLCAATGARGLVYSRPGYGRSTPRAAAERWPVDFMHRQAHAVLPALFTALGVRARPWHFGHSDGGSIALLYAARFPDRVAGVVVLAPHLFVEDVSIASIEDARHAYATTDLQARLARYHDDPDSAFRGWNDTWLDPAFRSWDITREIAAIRCPLLAIQGEDDQYGTMAQIDTIAAHVPGTQLLRLAECGHSPQRDQPAAVMKAVARMLEATSMA
jgi:pimeloyl-ACP methyl ester carboxylesterase